MDKIQRHKELCEKLNKVYEQKNEKYGDSFGTSIQKYGMIAALTRISDKFHRFEQLVLAKEDGSDTDESIVDTCLDAANYFLMTVIEMENNNSKRSSDSDDIKNKITSTSSKKEISNIKEDEKINLWKTVEDMAPSIKPEWTYNPKHEFTNI